MKIFVDAGAYKGLTVKAFKNSEEYTEDFKIYAFEPNPHAKVHKNPRGAIVIKKAVWIKDGVESFYTNRKHKVCQGASLLREKTSGGLNKKKPLKVETVDFGKWIMQFDITDYIIVKMDIEGAEFRVLDKMIKDGSINYIDKLYLETHGIHVGQSDDKLHEKLAKIKTLKVEAEYSHLTYKKEKYAQVDKKRT